MKSTGVEEGQGALLPGNLPNGRGRGWEALRIAAMGAGDSLGPGRPHTSHIPGSQLGVSTEATLPCPALPGTSPSPSIPGAPGCPNPPLWVPTLPSASGPVLLWVSVSDSRGWRHLGENRKAQLRLEWVPPAPTHPLVKSHPLFPSKQEVPPLRASNRKSHSSL